MGSVWYPLRTQNFLAARTPISFKYPFPSTHSPHTTSPPCSYLPFFFLYSLSLLSLSSSSKRFYLRKIEMGIKKSNQTVTDNNAETNPQKMLKFGEETRLWHGGSPSRRAKRAFRGIRRGEQEQAHCSHLVLDSARVPESTQTSRGRVWVRSRHGFDSALWRSRLWVLNFNASWVRRKS